MKNLRRWWWLGVLAALLLAPSLAPAEMYVEAYGGGVQAANDPVSFNQRPVVGISFTASTPGKFNPAVMGGVKFGTWFVREGFLGCNYPDWAKYFGAYIDISFHSLNLRKEFGTNRLVIDGFPSTSVNSSFDEGNVFTFAFMFAARYGFCPDSVAPFGRLQPYIAVGPALMWVTFKEPTFVPFVYGPPAIAGKQIAAGADHDFTIGLVAETGIRWMALKNVSLDLSFKYRYCRPDFTFGYSNPFNVFTLGGAPGTVNLKRELHLFSAHLGVAYHF